MSDLLSDEANDDSQEDVMTPAELISKLEEAWMNEKFSPELLENKSEVVECVMEQLTHMEANLQRVKKGDAKASIHRMEIDRIRFVLSSYLRSRLQKIEKFFPHVLEREKSRGEGDPSLLSPEEFAFAKEYYANTETYLKAVALKRMPPNLQTVDLLKAVPEPCLDSFIFLRVKERQENILVEPETDDQRYRVCCGSRRGLSASNAVSNYSTTCFKWSCAVNLKVEPQRPCIRPPLTDQFSSDILNQAYLAHHLPSFLDDSDDDDDALIPIKNRRVVFADSRGLSLTAVRVFSDEEEQSDLDLLPSLQGLGSMTEDGYSCTVSTCCPGTQLKLGFPQPSADFQAFRAKLAKSMVILESCSVTEHALQGHTLLSCPFGPLISARITVVHQGRDPFHFGHLWDSHIGQRLLGRDKHKPHSKREANLSPALFIEPRLAVRD
ncbi:hypothetical protein L3Q82_022902 [Scortum barcoo]|uniref:Uncharacterized protein n=1 Tax=Scortum barcoo TaxID=214431 RepID=A0ACB8X0C9_9TELE|nr:hypothetical protein L3Q82_022902 [Scortum barcoo]